AARGGCGDEGAGAWDVVVGDDPLVLPLREEVLRILGSAVELGVALLAAEAPHLGHREAVDPGHGEPLLHVLELERLDDGLDLLHDAPAGDSASSARLSGSTSTTGSPRTPSFRPGVCSRTRRATVAVERPRVRATRAI